MSSSSDTIDDSTHRWSSCSSVSLTNAISNNQVVEEEIALKIFNKLITVPIVDRVRLSFDPNNDRNLQSAVILCRQFNLARNKELYFTQFAVINNGQHGNTLISMSSRLASRTDVVNISSDSRKVVSIGQTQRRTPYIAIGLVEGSMAVVDLENHSICKQVYIPRRDFGALEWNPSNELVLATVKPTAYSTIMVPDQDLNIFRIFRNTQYSDRTIIGEGMDDIEEYRIALISSESGCIELLPTPAKESVSQFEWAPDGKSFYLISTRNSDECPLGQLFCTNRPTRLTRYNCQQADRLREKWIITTILNGDLTKFAYHCPKISPDNRTLIYTRNQTSGGHSHCRAICCIDLPVRRRAIESELVAVVKLSDVSRRISERMRNRPRAYTGLYEDLPETCWLEDSSAFVFSANDGFHKNMFLFKFVNRSYGKNCGVLISIRSPSEADIDSLVVPYSTYHKEGEGSWIIKGVRKQYLTAVYSSMHLTQHVFIANMDKIKVCLIDGADSRQAIVPWSIAFVGRTIFNEITFFTSILELKVPLNTKGRGANQRFLIEECMLIACSPDYHSRPTVVYVHGGPNDSFCETFDYSHLNARALVACGFNVLALNYIGSTGYGQSSIDRLSARAMENDIDSCSRLILDACEVMKLDKRKLFIMGSSHGGAIALMLTIRNPKDYKAAVLKNPIVDFIHMLLASDAPDIIVDNFFEEPLHDMNFDNYLTPESVTSLMGKSPIKHIIDIQTPLLFLLSTRNERVPYHAALRLSQILQTKNVPVKVRLYEDGHILKKLDNKQDAFVHTFSWFTSFLIEDDEFE